MKGDKRASPFFLIMMVFLGDMNALVFANDLTWMFFFWEVTTLCSFLLIRHYHDEASIKASDRALWMNLLGGVALSLRHRALEPRTGRCCLSELAGAEAALPGILSSLPASAALLPFALMAFGAFTKSALMPFNSWLTGAMVAPTPVSALLHSSTMVNAGVYLLIRIAPLIVGSFLSTLIAVIGGFSFMFCALLALSQTDTKRILAYSTISYLGLIAMCTGINTGLALTAAVALLMFHAVSKGLLFLCVGEVQHETGARDIESMEGLVNRMPLVAYIMVIGLISLMAPPFGVFVGKWLAFQSVSTFTTISLSLLDICFIIFGSIFSVFYYSRWAGNIGHEAVRGAEEGAPRLVHGAAPDRAGAGSVRHRGAVHALLQQPGQPAARIRRAAPAYRVGHPERHRRVLASGLPDIVPDHPAGADGGHQSARDGGHAHLRLRHRRGAGGRREATSRTSSAKAL